MEKKDRDINPWLFLPIIALVLIPMAVYFIVFGKNGLAKTSSDWSNFATFLNVFITFCNFYLFTVLTIKIFQYNRKRDKANDTFQQNIQQPILVFKSEAKPGEREIWLLENIGNGPALNIRVSESRTNTIKWVIPVTKCYSLGKGDKFPLKFLLNAAAICAIYEDIFGEQYVTLGANDESEFQKIDDSFRNMDVAGHSFDINQARDFLNLQTQRLHQALKSSTTGSNTTHP